MTRNSINNKNERVSAYGFACGYVEMVENGHKHATIWLEGGIYHVRWQLDKDDEITRYWEREGNGWKTYERLADARKQYDTVARLVRAA